jgi:hypothetical protein
MYENGGNMTHRFLDGHPQLSVYPFESQLGTALVHDQLSAMFPAKYRWPVFDLAATPAADFAAIIDEECKVRARTPFVSKFRHWSFELSDDERGEIYAQYIGELGRSRATNVEAFFRATFDAWKDYLRSGREEVFVGYSPVAVVDAQVMLRELPAAHMLHVVRNPWSAYADTKKRPVPLPLDRYLFAWCVNQQFALAARELFPERMHVVRTEDTMVDPVATLGPICAAVGVEPGEMPRELSWNGSPLAELTPWGTIRIPTPEANLATALELTSAEREEVRFRAGSFLEIFGYTDFLDAG